MASIFQTTFSNGFSWMLNENVRISIQMSLKFISNGPIYNIPTLVQIMAWCRLGDRPLSESRMVSLLTHICVARPQWVKTMFAPISYSYYGHMLNVHGFTSLCCILGIAQHVLVICFYLNSPKCLTQGISNFPEALKSTEQGNIWQT